SPSLSSFTVADVRIVFGGEPALSRPRESAIEKHPASAAPMISSGLLPGCPSKRVPSENGISGACAAFMTPLPDLMLPSHGAVALLIVTPHLLEVTRLPSPARRRPRGADTPPPPRTAGKPCN